MRRAIVDFWVGIFVLIGVVCLTFLAFRIASKTTFGIGRHDSYTLEAVFSNIGTLKTDAPVKISGFTIGRVANIAIDPKSYQAVVTMQINQDYRFTTDTSAQILTVGLLGEQYVALQNGASDIYLQNGGRIMLTSSALVLEDLIGKFLTNTSSSHTH